MKVRKMSEWILISALIAASLIVIGLILTLILIKKKKEGKIVETNYQVFFIIGIAWIPIGIAFMVTINPAIGMAFMAMGIAYLLIGLANRDKWDKM
jgi:hypothetical protein